MEDLDVLGSEWTLLQGFKVLNQFVSRISTSQRNYIISNIIKTYQMSINSFKWVCVLKWEGFFPFKNCTLGASLVAQWLGIRLPMQGTRVRALVGEDPTCRRATKPVHHNDWACALEPVSHNYWAHVPQLLKPTRLEPVLHNKRSHHSEKPVHRNKDPMQLKII